VARDRLKAAGDGLVQFKERSFCDPIREALDVMQESCIGDAWRDITARDIVMFGVG